MDLTERIGKTAFEFNLLFSIVTTIIGTALLANGINPGNYITGLFMPIDWLYRSTVQVQSSLPQDFNPLDIVTTLGATGIIAIFLEFMFMMLLGFLVLVYTISVILPAQLAFLTVPLYFLGAFIQLMVWVYAIGIMIDKLASILPWR